MASPEEDVALERPAAADLIERFQQLVKEPMLSAAYVRRKATSGSIGGPGEASLRSLYWRICLGVVSSSPSVWPDAFRRLRQSWTDLHDYLRAPDGTWVDGAKPPRDWRGSSAPAVVYNPLGNETGNPWPAWYEDLELRRIIRQDVERTFPDNPYFRSKRVRDSLTNILFCFAKLHVDVSYRQGMHEILAIIFWCTDMDTIETPREQQSTAYLASLVLAREYVEHDAYSLFNVLMTNMLSWYDPNLSAPSQLSLPNGRKGSVATASVQPIVAKCARIHELLKKVDFELWKRMEELQIEPQIYGIRWLRLLFSREFPIGHTLVLWDAIFAEDLHPLLHIADYVCLAMLLRIRESLLDSDYSTFLHGLLRYPLPIDGDPRALLLVQQANYLRDNPTNFGGAYVRRQNIQLGVEAGTKTGSRAEEAMYENFGRTRTPLSPPPSSRLPTPATAVLIDQGRSIAEGLYGRAEALGINKAVFSALGDLKRSVQSYQAQQAQSTLSEIPTTPSWEIDAARNKGADLKKLRHENRAMGNALAASLRLLNANLGALSKDRSAQVLASLQTIEHVKNVLIGDDKHFNPRVAEDLIEAASANLTQSISSNAVSEGLGPASTSILDQDTPMAEQSENLAPGNRAGLPELATQSKSLSVGDSTIHNATAPNAISLPTAPQPIHSNNAIITHPVGVIGTFPDLGDWQSVAEPVPHPLSGTPVLPRLPPISRATRIHGSGRQSLHGDTPLETLSQPQEKVKRQDTTEFDPLGVLFQA